MQHRQTMAINLDALEAPDSAPDCSAGKLFPLSPEEQPNWLARLIVLPYGKIRWQDY